MSKMETLEITDLGNSNTKSSKAKRSIPGKKFCCTIFNNDMKEMETLFRKDTSKGIIATEICPDTSKVHLQCFFVFNNKIRPNEKYKSLQGRWFKCKGTDEDNYDYCTKDDHFVRWGLFHIDYKINRNDLNKHQLEIADKFILDEDSKFGRKIYWYWEKEGGWGKSLLATYMVDNMNAIMVSGQKKDVLFGVSQMVEKGKFPKIVVVDIPRVNANAISIQGIEMIKNGMFYNEKYESGMCRFPRPHIVCFANCPPPLKKMSKDRWIVTHLRPQECLVESDSEDDEIKI